MKVSYGICLFLLLLIVTTFGFSEIEENFSKQIFSSFAQHAVRQDTTAFDKIMTVVMHQRCMNCHPAGDRPYQSEEARVHSFNVKRGPANFGEGALSCATCHHEENNDMAGVPGAPHWSLAPKEMAWEGKSRIEIARSILDSKTNGGKNLAQTVAHLTEDALVLWAWEPGIDADGFPREKPPIPKEEFIKAVKEWAAAGAIIPEK